MIPLDRKATRALHGQVYDGFRTAIVEGRLRSGQRIPSTRVLAFELGISRFPVLTAYSQLLAEGYFESRVGSGTAVSRSLPNGFLANHARTSASKAREDTNRVPNLNRSLKPLWLQGTGAFAVGEIAFDHFPHKLWASLVSRRSRNERAESLHYGDPLGLLELREEVAEYLRAARSVHCDADQIMIVSGSQQALDLSARVLVHAGDSVWVEEPGYRPARDVFSRQGCRLISVPVDNHGMDVAAGIEQCLKSRVAVLTPSHQLPLGVTMSATRRLQILEWARTVGAWIIEDDYDSEYRYDSSPIASLQGLDKAERVIYVGTFSKVLFPSLRLGYLVIPRNLIDRFAATRTMMDSCPPGFFQGVVADFIRDGHFARHIRRMRTVYSKRRKALADSLICEFGSGMEIVGSSAGLYLTGLLREGAWRDVDVSGRAAAQNLRVWPLSACYAGKPHLNGFMLGYGNTLESEMPHAVRRFRNVVLGK